MHACMSIQSAIGASRTGVGARDREVSAVSASTGAAHLDIACGHDVEAAQIGCLGQNGLIYAYL